MALVGSHSAWHGYDHFVISLHIDMDMDCMDCMD